MNESQSANTYEHRNKQNKQHERMNIPPPTTSGIPTIVSRD